ncbi:hypothetical protein MTO96_039241, partial [Rhipicephalus appendiculatus]
MEALKLKRKAERAQLTRLINEAEATLTQDWVTEEELRILNERLNQLHNDLRATDSDIVPLLSTTEAEAEFNRVVDYNNHTIAKSAKLKYRIPELQEFPNPQIPTCVLAGQKLGKFQQQQYRSLARNVYPPTIPLIRVIPPSPPSGHHR